MSDDSKNCKHDKYSAATKMSVVNMPELNTWQLIIRVSAHCARCNKAFTFRARNGFSTREPTISNDSQEIRIPIDYPEEEDLKTTQTPPEGIVH